MNINTKVNILSALNGAITDLEMGEKAVPVIKTIVNELVMVRATKRTDNIQPHMHFTMIDAATKLLDAPLCKQWSKPKALKLLNTIITILNQYKTK